MSGFVALHRDAIEHHLFQGDSARLGAWFWLVAKACWAPTRVRIKGETVDLDRGELSFSVRFLAEAWGWSKSRVDRFLADLRAENMIATRSKIGTACAHKAGQGQSIITICNYAKYQDMQSGERDNSGTTRGTTAGQQRDKEEQRNKGTIEPNGSITPLTPLSDGELDSGCAPASPAPKATLISDAPEWLPVDQWNAFIEMRRKKRAAPTPHAVDLLVSKLGRLRSAGNDPGEVLDQSTMQNWTDIYEIKDKANANRNRQANGNAPAGYRERDRRDGFTRAIDRLGGLDQPGGAAGAAGRPNAGDGPNNRELAPSQGRTLLK